MENLMIPEELSSFIGSENKDFAVKANRSQPLKKTFSLIFKTIVYFAVASVLIFSFLDKSFKDQGTEFTLNGLATLSNLETLKIILMPALLISFLAFIGFNGLFRGIYLIFKKGGYFVGTPSRLVRFQNDKIRSIDWEQFSGDIEVHGNAQKGSISFKLRTGKMIKRKNRPSAYVPETIYISEIENVFEIEKLCRKRIKENDPTKTISL